MHACIFACMCVCMRMCVCMHVYIYACMHVYVYVCSCVQARNLTHFYVVLLLRKAVVHVFLDPLSVSTWRLVSYRFLNITATVCCVLFAFLLFSTLAPPAFWRFCMQPLCALSTSAGALHLPYDAFTRLFCAMTRFLRQDSHVLRLPGPISNTSFLEPSWLASARAAHNALKREMMLFIGKPIGRSRMISTLNTRFHGGALPRPWPRHPLHQSLWKPPLCSPRPTTSIHLTSFCLHLRRNCLFTATVALPRLASQMLLVRTQLLCKRVCLDPLP